MRYANIQMNRSGRCSLGDDIQVLAIENLYKYMGIDNRDIVRIPFTNLVDYDGDYVVLPLSFPFHGFYNGTLIGNLSPRIVPVYLGMSTLTNRYDVADVNYFRRFEPIGCRDQWTMEAMRSYGIRAYLGGCMTAAFPKVRDGKNGRQKVFCIDVPDYLKQHIPSDLLERAEFVSHVVMADECPDGTEQQARDLYNRYVDEAELIITTRMHGAIPCLAAGIPVVLAKDVSSTRFMMIEKLTHVYGPDEFDRIDWNPPSADFENLKEDILKLAAKRVREVYENYNDELTLSIFYEERRFCDRDIYIDGVNNTLDYLHERFNENDSFHYSIWGITQSADLVIERIKADFPQACLDIVVDRRTDVVFHGKKAVAKEELLNYPSSLCLVCAPAAMPEAKEFFLCNDAANYYLCWVDGLER